jgi:hypothetical protein
MQHLCVENKQLIYIPWSEIRDTVIFDAEYEITMKFLRIAADGSQL